jgi:hypothetical protein
VRGRSEHLSRRCWTIIAPLVCCAITVLSASAPQSLADIARAEAERRKTIAQPSRVYTNKDLKPVPSPGPPPAADAAPASGDEPPRLEKEKRDGASPQATDGPAKGQADEAQDEDQEEEQEEEKRRTEEEQRWRARMAEAHDQLERSRLLAEALQSRIHALNADFAARDDPAQRAAIGTQLKEALAELERVRGDIEAQQKAITDLEEEARRAGVPPGWLR